MFGYVTASLGEMTPEQQERYGGVYCGICRSIKAQASQAARLGLSYDITFLSLLLMSLYEPEEETGRNHCILHPKRRSWIENEYVRYGADMNVALAYYNCLDDWQDDGKRAAKLMANILGKSCPAIEEKYPRQCGAIRDCITALSRLEKAGLSIFYCHSTLFFCKCKPIFIRKNSQFSLSFLLNGKGAVSCP